MNKINYDPIPSLNSDSRIVVVGTSGSGKSTLARSLSTKLSLNDIELDALFWKPNWQQTPLPEFRESIQNAFSEKAGWVVHGNYGKVRDLTLKNAQVMIWLDYDLPLVLWRVFKRSVSRIIFREKLWAENRESFRKTFLSKESIILWSIQTHGLRKQQYTDVIKDPEFKHLTILRFKTPKETNQFLAAL